jgi:capsular polysaccharide transport system permease protein
MQTEQASSEAESTIDLRHRLRAEARARRLRQRLIVFGAALTPALFAVIYLVFLATPQYLAESRFAVQAAQSVGQGGSGSSVSSMTSLLSGGAGGANAAAGFVDGWLVQDFLNSRDCMRQLDQKIGLRKYLVRNSFDPINHLDSKANEDQLYAAYQRVVHNSFNMIEQINVLDVAAYSPSDSRAISDGLLMVVQDFVNKMNQLGINDSLKVSREAVQTALAQDKQALVALTQWRVAHADLDPVANATMLLNQIGVVETSLSTAQLNLDNIKALRNPNHPMLKPAQQQVEGLQQRVNELRSRISGQGNTSAGELNAYVELTNAQTFADNNLLQARQNYQQAFTNALALQRYLAIVARPVPEVRASQPNPAVFLLAAIAVGGALAGLLTLTLATYRSFRHA